MLRTTTCLILFAFGCATEPTFGEAEQGIINEPGDDGSGSGCQVWGCGSNSPVMGVFQFWELPEAIGATNAQGFRLDDFKKGSTRYLPDVVNGELLARDPNNPRNVLLRGGLVTGAVFYLHHVRTNRDYQLIVYAVGRTNMFIQPSPVTVATTPTYHLRWKYSDIAMHPVDLCGQSLENDGMDEFHAVLFEDDWIDADAIKVFDTPHYGYFNIGCRSHALAKQHLLGHTKAGAVLAGIQPTPTSARTANLKMLSADYCGNGHPFTVPGQPLYWKDARTTYDKLPPQMWNGRVEARWTAAGAICLNTPRVDYVWTQLGWETFGAPPSAGVEPLLAPAAGWCTDPNLRPPPCSGVPTDLQGADILSVNQ